MLRATSTVVVPQSSWQLVTFPPLGLMVAFTVAAVWEMADAGLLVTVGAFGSVVNVWSSPFVVPPALVPTTR